jgi:hypothetical protein
VASTAAAAAVAASGTVSAIALSKGSMLLCSACSVGAACAMVQAEGAVAGRIWQRRSTRFNPGNRASVNFTTSSMAGRQAASMDLNESHRTCGAGVSVGLS